MPSGAVHPNSNRRAIDVTEPSPPPRVRWLLDRPVKPGDDINMNRGDHARVSRKRNGGLSAAV
jgi:hypothetical protein